jgi:hypothetical protein
MRPWNLATLAACIAVVGCGGRDRPAPSAPSSGEEWFVERARASGLDFVHFNGMTGEYYYPEIMAPGVALLDYDNDNDLDVYVVQGQLLGPKTLKDATFQPKGALRDRLFRNDLTAGADGVRTLRFTDVTESSGIDVRSYGMGVAAGDVDNDGWVDLYRTGLDRGTLLHNNGNGTFADVTAKSGAENRGGWSVSAAFVDYDRDGWLDLYVGNYLNYSIAGDINCLSVGGRPDYCPPNSYRAQPDRLYRNRGDGTFADVTARALTGGADGPALGVSTADFDGDGWIDIYVGNDGDANQLWINQKNGTFTDTAFASGAAVNAAGNAEASMGIDAGDFDNDGDEDLFITNWQAQMNILYVNSGRGVFEDRKAASGLGAPSLAKTGFGTSWFDFDNDTWLDLLAVNGSVATNEAQARANEPFPLRMPSQLYRNLGNGRFDDVSGKAGRAFTTAEVSRGAAFGDIDNDGDTDVVVGNANGPLWLLVNNIGNRNHWLGLRLAGAASRAPAYEANVDPSGRAGLGNQDPSRRAGLGNQDPARRAGLGNQDPARRAGLAKQPRRAGELRDMLGARVEIVRQNGPSLWRRARSDGSYASANDPRVLVGLATAATPVRVRVTWPDGRAEEWPDVAVDQWLTLRQGTGR